MSVYIGVLCSVYFLKFVSMNSANTYTFKYISTGFKINSIKFGLYISNM